MTYLKSRLRVGGAIAAAVMCFTASMPPLSLGWLRDAQHKQEEVEFQLLSLRRVQSLLVDAETGQRGYVITGRDDFLQPYRHAVAELPKELRALEQRYRAESEQERTLIAEIDDHAKRKLEELARTVSLRQTSGFAAVEPLVSEGSGKALMDEVRSTVNELIERETGELASLDQELNSKVYWAIAFSVGSTLLSFALLAYLARMVSMSMRQRAKAAQELEEAGQRLTEGMSALQERNAEISTLSEMSRVLQTEMSLVEALEVTGLYCGRLLPDTHGSIFLFRNSADLLERASGWGDSAHEEQAMPPNACWGLRRGQLHRCCGPSQLKCQHYADRPVDGFHLCLPLMAYGEVLGQLHVWAKERKSVTHVDDVAAMAQTISEQVALSLSNAKLRQVLRDQSIKDPLTGLFNRRFMEETLQRELSRAQRTSQSLAVVVADLDHFKKINDTHGHPVGDAVLKGAAQYLRQALRASDVACRYGGEEFVLILPDCSREAALAKAQEMCERVSALHTRGGLSPVPISASFGVAAFPADADSAQALIEAADGALYDAKRSGRNRAHLASGADALRRSTAVAPVDRAAMAV